MIYLINFCCSLPVIQVNPGTWYPGVSSTRRGLFDVIWERQHIPISKDDSIQRKILFVIGIKLFSVRVVSLTLEEYDLRRRRAELHITKTNLIYGPCLYQFTHEISGPRAGPIDPKYSWRTMDNLVENGDGTRTR